MLEAMAKYYIYQPNWSKLLCLIHEPKLLFISKDFNDPNLWVLLSRLREKKSLRSLREFDGLIKLIVATSNIHPGGQDYQGDQLAHQNCQLQMPIFS
jgi:hypothetical protein